MITVEASELIVQTNNLIERSSCNKDLRTFIFSWKLQFQNKVMEIQSSYRKSKFKFSIIELVELLHFLEDSKISLFEGMKKYHK